MHRRSSTCVCKLLLGRPLQRSSIPTASFTTLSNQRISNSISPSNSEKAHLFLRQVSSNPPTQLNVCQNPRQYSVDANKEVDTINLKFAVAREEIEAALESKETVYFNEEAECARAAVKEVLDMYEGLLEKLPERERATVQRSMGLKIEQLKAELDQLDD